MTWGRFAQLARPDVAFPDAVMFEIARGWLRQHNALAAISGNRANDTKKMKEPIVKLTTTTVKTAIGAAGIAAVSVFAATTASAAPPNTPNIQGFGTSEQLIDGPMITSYTVSNLQPSNMSIPGYTPKGTLYQADITARSDGGTVTPMVRNFSARGPNGQTYKLIDKVEVPNGLNPAPIPQGSESRGTLYFDATGAPPNGVVYNDGLQDILIWTSNVPGAPAPGAPPNTNPAPGAPPAPATHT
jgi:Domain of unknown function (DUF1942)